MRVKQKMQPYLFQSRRIFLMSLGAAALAIVLTSYPLAAQVMVRQVNLAYLAQRADVIVQGRVSSVSHEHLPGYPNIPTVKVTLEVENMLRGPEAKSYTIRELFVGLRSKQGKSDYIVGQRLLLFLPLPSEYGLSSPIGMGQGRFLISANGGGMIANEFGNAGLFQNVERDANAAGKRLTTSQSRIAVVDSGPVALNEFVSLVRDLTSLPRIQ